MMKRIFALALAFLLCAHHASAAIVSVGNLGSTGSAASTTTLVITTGADVEVGNCVAVFIANDNLGSSDGDNNDVTGVADSGGVNSYSQLGAEHTYAEGGAGNGANVAAFGMRAASLLSSGGTITITFASAIVAKAARAWEYTCGATLEFVSGSQQTESINGTGDNGSLAISGLDSQEYLCLRVMGRARNNTANITPTTNFTDLGDVLGNSGADATSMRLDAEQLIFTGTGCTSDPTFPVPGSSDAASTLIAIREFVAASISAGPFRRRSQ